MMYNLNFQEVADWGTGWIYLRDRVAGTTSSVQSMLPAGNSTLRSARTSPDGTHVIAVMAGPTVTQSNGIPQSPISVAFIQLGGPPTVVPYSVGDPIVLLIATPITDVAIDGSSAVVRDFLVGKDGSIQAVPGQQVSVDRTAAAWTCRPHDQPLLCRLFTAEDGAQYMHRTESGAASNGQLERVVFTRDGMLYVSSRSTNLGPVVPPPGDLGTTYIYLFDPTP